MATAQQTIGGCVLRVSVTLPPSTMSALQVLSTAAPAAAPATPTACVSASVFNPLSAPTPKCYIDDGLCGRIIKVHN